MKIYTDGTTSELKNVAHRLKELKLWSLEDRRIRVDLVEVFKITHGLSSLSLDTFLYWTQTVRQEVNPGS